MFFLCSIVLWFHFFVLFYFSKVEIIKLKKAASAFGAASFHKYRISVQ